MDKKVKLRFASYCEIEEYNTIKKIDNSRITLRVDCPCGGEGCILVQFVESEDSEIVEEEK